jgi:hypothetical protein
VAAGAKKISVGKKSARSTDRVESTEGKSPGGMAKRADHRSAQPTSVVPEGMIEIGVQLSELVPVAQYANVTVGPLFARRLIPDPGLDKLDGTDMHEYNEEQSAIADAFQAPYKTMLDLIEEIAGEDRENILESVREVNKRRADEDEDTKKK